MYVHEYLEFVGRLYKLKGKALRNRVAEIVEMTGLGRELEQPLAEAQRHPGHRVYPYLLRHLDVTRPNQVWAMDLT